MLGLEGSSPDQRNQRSKRAQRDDLMNGGPALGRSLAVAYHESPAAIAATERSLRRGDAVERCGGDATYSLGQVRLFLRSRRRWLGLKGLE
jgi:hypothetical protein